MEKIETELQEFLGMLGFNQSRVEIKAEQNMNETIVDKLLML